MRSYAHPINVIIIGEGVSDFKNIYYFLSLHKNYRVPTLSPIIYIYTVRWRYTSHFKHIARVVYNVSQWEAQ